MKLIDLISEQGHLRFRRATKSDHHRGYIGWVLQGRAGGYDKMLSDPDEVEHREIGWNGGPRFRYYVENPKATIVWTEMPDDDDKFTAENWLHRKGEEVARHIDINQYANMLTEGTNADSDIKIEDFTRYLERSYIDRDSASHIRTVEHFYNSENPEHKQLMLDYFKVLNEVKDRVLDIAKKLGIPYVSIPTIKYYLTHQQEFRMKPSDFFPFPLYISSSPDEQDTIGVMVDEHGKVLEIHEGNDEATPNTINLANKLLNPSGKRVRIYGAHGIPLVRKIEETGYLPSDLYVSKDRGHASGHLDLKGERTLFTGIIDINAVSQESDLDWRVMEPTKIDKFRYL